MSTPNTVRLYNYDHMAYKEGTVAASKTIYPGHLIEKDSSGEFQPHSTAGGNIVPYVAIEEDYIGNIITDTYGEDENVRYVVARPGEEFYMLLAAGENVAIGDLLESYGDGTLRKAVSTSVASAAVAASLSTGDEEDNNALTFTAKDAGSAGNGISVTLSNTAGGASLGVAVNDNNIVVTLADDGTDPTSTAAQVKAAIEAEADANALVTVAHTGDSDGSGVVAAVAATSLTGGIDAGEVTSSATTVYPKRYFGSALEAKNNSSGETAARIRVEAI